MYPEWSLPTTRGFSLQTEFRTISASALEVRAADDEDQGPVFAGHAAVYNSPSLDLGGFREIIAPGAFRKSLRSRGNVVKSFFNHDPSFVLGRTDNKTLTVKEDDTGLAFEVTPPDTQWARDLEVSLRRGDVRDASFAFRAIRDKWSEEADGTSLRTLLEVELFELGPVSNGAYPAADSQVRAMLEARGIALDIESAEITLPTLRAIGLNLDDLEAALLRLKAAGDTPADADVEEIRAAITALESALPRAAPIPDESWRISLANRRRRLELLKLAR